MTRLAPETYLAHVREESARFRAVLADCDPTARVPSCPDWNAADLLWHLATVQRWWAEVITARPARPDEVDPPRPESYDDLLASFDQWTDHTAGFILRRQAHEALIHRVDAELAAGLSSEVDPSLASDGVHEVLAVMYGGCPPWGNWEPGDGLLRVDTTDTGEEIWLRFGTFSGTDPDGGTTYADEEDFHVVEAPADDTHISVAGDRTVLEHFSTIVANPLN